MIDILIVLDDEQKREAVFDYLAKELRDRPHFHKVCPYLIYAKMFRINFVVTKPKYDTRYYPDYYYEYRCSEYGLSLWQLGSRRIYFLSDIVKAVNAGKWSYRDLTLLPDCDKWNFADERYCRNDIEACKELYRKFWY
nr:hypothetical protein [uncultured Mediterraneibacter sp.]